MTTEPTTADALSRATPTQRPARPRRQWWQRRSVQVLLLVSGCVGVIADNYAYQRYQGNNSTLEPLNAAVKELDRTDPGWRLQDIEKARAAVPAESNSAAVVADAVEALARYWQPPEQLLGLADRPPEYQLDDQDA